MNKTDLEMYKEVEEALYKNATGYEYEETTTNESVDLEGKAVVTKEVVKKTAPANLDAQKFWLENKKPRTTTVININVSFDKEEIDYKRPKKHKNG